MIEPYFKEKVNMPSIKDFIEKLEKIKIDHLGSSENLYSGDSLESSIRRNNLENYFNLMYKLKPKYMLLGEAPGYKGCRLTGIPFTSEKILAQNPFFNGYNFKFINQKLESEQSATIVWDVLNDIQMKPLIWNIFPFHPYDGIDLNTNRTPNEKELELGKELLKELITIFDIKLILAVGRKAESKLSDLGIGYKYIRHPANGGKNKFVEGLQQI